MSLESRKAAVRDHLRLYYPEFTLAVDQYDRCVFERRYDCKERKFTNDVYFAARSDESGLMTLRTGDDKQVCEVYTTVNEEHFLPAFSISPHIHRLGMFKPYLSSRHQHLYIPHVTDDNLPTIFRYTREGKLDRAYIMLQKLNTNTMLEHQKLLFEYADCCYATLYYNVASSTDGTLRYALFDTPVAALFAYTPFSIVYDDVITKIDCTN